MAVPVYIGVDVGTGSVRAIAVTCSGIVRGHSTVPITVHNPGPDYYEQDSQQIWRAVGQAVQEACQQLQEGDLVSGLGFDATCSLVVLDEHRLPLSVDKHSGEDSWNVVMWMDHRADQEAAIINSKPHSVLQYVGGSVSIEMQTPKLLWLKRNLPETWRRAAHLMDLPDYLTMSATGELTRSLCSLVCKWTYVQDGTSQGWDKTFFADVGLGELTEDHCAKIGNKVLRPGVRCGTVTTEAAAVLGVPVGTPVSSSLIDAHAGALALLTAGAPGTGVLGKKDLTGMLAIISGTSACHLICSHERHDVPGVWGPYHSALLPGCWLAEAGLCVSGALVDHVIAAHPALDPTVPKHKLNQWADELVGRLTASKGLTDPTTLTTALHVYPDYHGNRSPLADPLMTGMVCGLTLSAGEDNLALQYLATIQSLAYATRAILDTLRSCGHRVSAVMVCGGLAQSQIFTQTHADVLGVPIVVPEDQQQTVVRGAAMLGALAAAGDDVTKMAPVLQRIAGNATRTLPNPKNAKFHEQKYRVYRKMQADQLEYRKIMNTSL